MESDFFLDEYPRWDLGTLHQPVILLKMFLHATTRGWKEAECMCHQGCQGSVREPDPEMDQTALQLIGYHTLQKELRDVCHSVYLLNRAPQVPHLWSSTTKNGNQRNPLLPLREVTQADIPTWYGRFDR